MIYGIWLIILGVLGASNLIIAKRPDAKEAIGKLAPYQGWMGAISALGGAFDIISSLGLITTHAVYGFTWLGVGAVQLLLGFLLGIGVLKSFVKDAKANEKMDQMMTKLSPYQGTLGLVAIGLGVWFVVAGFMFL